MRYRDIITAEAASGPKIVKPIKPLTVAQQQRRQEKNLKTQKRIRDEQAKSARKVADLRADLT